MHQIGFGLCKVGKFLYAFGGINDHGHLDSVERYDIDNGQWERMEAAVMPFSLYVLCLFARAITDHARTYFATAVVNEDIYAIAGTSPYHGPSNTNVPGVKQSFKILIQNRYCDSIFRLRPGRCSLP